MITIKLKQVINIKLIICLLLVLWSLHCFANVKNPYTLTIYTEQFPPYNFIENDDIKGINIDIVKQLCINTGITCQFELYPWNRAFDNTLKNPDSGLVSTSRNASREERFKWIGPLISGENQFYRLKSRTDIQVNSLEELTQYTTGAQAHDIYEEVLTNHGFKKGYNLLETRSKAETVKLFFNGKIDLFILSPISLEHQLHQYGYREQLVEPVFPVTLNSINGNYLALNKNVPDDVFTKLQRALDELRNKKLLHEFKNTYSINK